MPIWVSPQPHLGLLHRAPLEAGEAGTAQTIKAMRELVDHAVSDPAFVRQAKDIVRHVPSFDEVGEVYALYQWVKHNIRYTKDPVTKETLYPPQEFLKIRSGDCDDISMLIGALGIALGYPARLITISADASSPQEFSHVYPELEVPAGSRQWIPLDCASPGAEFGLEPPMYYRKRAWSLTDDSYQDLNGCKCGSNCDCGGSIGTGRLCGALAGYATVAGYQRFNAMAGLGQDGIDWGSIVQTGLQEVPSIIAVSSGAPTSIKNPYGTVQTGVPGSPYGSFATQYTPGYGVPYAGYSSPSAGTAWLSQNWPILGLGLVALMMLGRKS